MGDVFTRRLDAFADAAFAFAVSLMVVGAGASTVDGTTLRQSVAAIPSFAIGFAIIVMFWATHARWRGIRGDGDWRSALLTLLLVFAVLIYVVPLRAMATSFAAYLAGDLSAYRGSIGELFAIYGLGFVLMSVLTALLFRDALRNPDLDAGQRLSSLGQVWIWTILATTGAVSVTLALFDALAPIAPWLYATLPVTIGLFSWLWEWEPTPAEP